MKKTAASAAWQLPSVSLRSHRCASLLWIPLSVCLQCASEPPGNNDLKKTINDRTTNNTNSNNNNNTGNNTTDTILTGAPTALVEEKYKHTMSGFELRVLATILQEPLVPMRSLRGVFPAATEYYVENAVLEVAVRVADTTAAIAASPWGPVEAHRSPAAVVVVLNSYEYEPRSALTAVKLVFQRYFKETTCRCLVLDPTVDAQASMSQHFFLPAYTNTPVEDVARYLLREISLSVVQQINAHIVALKPTANMTPAAIRQLSEEFGGINGESDALKKRVLGSRVAKKKGDLLLQLGALDSALLVYHESLSASDALWASATLESIAALRYLQRAPLIEVKIELDKFFSLIEGEEVVWNLGMASTLNQFENAVENLRTEQRKAATLLRQSLSSSSLGRKLFKEVEEPLTVHGDNFRRFLASIRKYFAPESKDTLDTSLEEICRNVHTTFKQIFHLSFLELHLYLNESLQQLRSASATQKGNLRVREACIHLQCTELFAEEGDKKRFLESLMILRLMAKDLPERAQREIRDIIPSLCSRCGCDRKAIYYVTEAAILERKAGARNAAIGLLLQACNMTGISFPNTEFQYQSIDLISTPNYNSWSGNDGSKSSGVMECHPRRAQDVLLLMELLSSVKETDVDDGMKTAVASLLLFEYHSFLHRETQQTLMDIIEHSSEQFEPVLSVPPPLLENMEILALPPHLAPKTVPLSGAQFTFIDTGRLKMTVLTLNGKVLPRGQVVWSVGTVGEVELYLTNPFRRDLQLTSIALSCRSLETLPNDLDSIEENYSSHIVGPLAPSSYVVTGVILPSFSKRRLCLQVQPNTSGYLVVDGVEIRLGQLPLCSTFFIPSRNLTPIPVLEELPLVSFTLGINEVEIFGGQKIRFPLHISNAGTVDIRRLHLTVHDENCQLDGCSGCKQRVSARSLYVLLEHNSLDAMTPNCLSTGKSMLTQVTLVAPAGNDNVVFQHVVFRATVELPHEQPVAPDSVPSAVPVFAVIPRRVREAYLRVFHVPGIAVTSLALSRNRRYVEITVKNKSRVHTIEILCSHMSFTNIPDALVVAGAEYLIPPIEITKIPPSIGQFQLPWVVRELPECRGVVSLDFSIISTEVVCTEPLEDALVNIEVQIDDTRKSITPTLNSQNGTVAANTFPFTLPAMKPVLLSVSVNAPWKRMIPLRVRLAMENHMDADALSGPADTTSIVGGAGEEEDVHVSEKKQYEETFEFLAFKTGEHVLTITLSDPDGREMMYHVQFQVEHL
ncbi:hypothetical protein LSM04_007795 [Trypanosoma melophagium]|uniref:uncharacterized protein n=1 Tax=Trypanosoma melophagium TaxID=715481 RepID=UPI00351A162B|nr:hypothetical protein LSM04_007795 [Trypanosoma melophagium]